MVDAPCERLPERLRRLAPMPRCDRGAPRFHVRRADLVSPPIPPLRHGLADRPARLFDRRRPLVRRVSRVVTIDERVKSDRLDVEKLAALDLPERVEGG